MAEQINYATTWLQSRCQGSTYWQRRAPCPSQPLAYRVQARL